MSLTQSPLALWKTRILAMKCAKWLQTATSTTKLTHPIRLARSFRSSFVKNAHNLRFARRRLDKKPHQPKIVHANAVKDKDGQKHVDFNAINCLAPMTPPFCIVGAAKRVYLRPVSWDLCRLGVGRVKDVGDLVVVKDRVVAVGHNCVFLVGGAKYLKFGMGSTGVSIHVR